MDQIKKDKKNSQKPKIWFVINILYFLLYGVNKWLINLITKLYFPSQHLYPPPTYSSIQLPSSFTLVRYYSYLEHLLQPISSRSSRILQDYLHNSPNHHSSAVTYNSSSFLPLYLEPLVFPTNASTSFPTPSLSTLIPSGSLNCQDTQLIYLRILEAPH